MIEVDLAPDLPRVMADRRRILQVLGNLFSNASRYSPEASTIRVTAVRNDIHVALSVVDEGRGVSDDRLPHLFRKFSRTDGEPGGSGVGLAICKGFVEAHGGRIWAENNRSGLGARFTFTIPAIEGAAISAVQFSAPYRMAEREQMRVLVVDDDPQILKYVRETLSEAGYVVAVTADPDEAVAFMKTKEPHLVLLDLMLSGTDGIELMGRIVRIVDVPVIFLSGYGEDRYISRAFEMGAADYVVKPFSPTEVVARIGAALRKREVPDDAASLGSFVLGDLLIEYVERRETLADRSIRLTATEYHLLQRGWWLKKPGDPRMVRTIVKNLRRKLGGDAKNPTYIVTEPRVGYRMERA